MSTIFSKKSAYRIKKGHFKALPYKSRTYDGLTRLFPLLGLHSLILKLFSLLCKLDYHGLIILKRHLPRLFKTWLFNFKKWSKKRRSPFIFPYKTRGYWGSILLQIPVFPYKSRGWRGPTPMVVVFLVLVMLSLSSLAMGREKIKVVVTLNFLKDFVENVGGDRVEVKSLLTGLESEHTYTPEPADIIAIKRADVLIKVGLGLEVWVDSLIRNANNGHLLIINTSNNVPLLEDQEGPYSIGKSPGSIGQNRTWSHHKELHRIGNPHIWLDPERAKAMIKNITDGLIRIDPAGKSFYLSNQKRYLESLDKVIKEIKTLLAPIKNRRIITHHPAWEYFAERFGLEIVDSIQYQVGTEPSARHIADIIKEIKKYNIKVIVAEPQLNRKIPETIAKETGAKVITLTPIPGGIPGTETYIKMLEYTGRTLASALK